jgi:hypothetical protein
MTLNSDIDTTMKNDERFGGFLCWFSLVDSTPPIEKIIKNWKKYSA